MTPPPSTELPARWRRMQRWKNHLAYALIRLTFGLLRFAPLGMMRLMMRALAYVMPLVARGDTQTAHRNLSMAMPELNGQARRKIVHGMFAHLGQVAAEVAHLNKLLPPQGDVELDKNSRAVLDAALKEGKGVVAVTGHIGNWELLAQVVAQAGYPITTIAKPLYDPRLTRFVHEFRTARGLRVIWRGENTSSKAILRVFRERGLLALLIDQDTRVPGTFVPFFGREAYTPTAAASLALRAQAPVVIGWSRRIGNTYRFTIERCNFTPSQDPEADVERLTAQLTQRLESIIREAPEQWVWLHRRWRRRPNSE